MDFTDVCPQEYGDIEYCVILKNKTTGESKGLGYVRYYKPSQAALAIENCDKSKDFSDALSFTVLQEVDKPFEFNVFFFLCNFQLSNLGVL